MSNKRKRNAKTTANYFEKAIKEAISKDQTSEETKSLHSAVRDHLTNEAGGADHFYGILFKILTNARQSELKKLRALSITDYTFRKSKDFRGIVCRHLSTVVKACCGRAEHNAADILHSEVAKQLMRYIHEWDKKFGIHYQELRVIAKYYTESVRVLDTNGLTPDSASRLEGDRPRLLLYATCQNILSSSLDHISTAEANFKAAQEIFDILFPSFSITAHERDAVPVSEPDCLAKDIESLVPSDAEDDVIEWEDGGVEEDKRIAHQNLGLLSTVTSAGLISLDYSLDITIGVAAGDVQTADNEILVSTLKEITTAFKKYTVPRFTEWLGLFHLTKDQIERAPLNKDIEGELMAQLPGVIDQLDSVKNRIVNLLEDKLDIFFKVSSS